MSKTSQLSTIFLDTGNYFNKDEFVFVPLKKHGTSFEVIVTLNPNVIGIRFDPYERYGCLIGNLKIIADGNKIDYRYINGEKIGNILFFDTLDPSIAIDFYGINFSKVKISGNIYRIKPCNVPILLQYGKFYEKLLKKRKWIKIVFNLFFIHIFYLKYLKMSTKNYTGKLYSPKQKIKELLNIKLLFKKDIRLSYSPPIYDNNELLPSIFEGKVYTQYAAELENAIFFSCSNLILFEGKVLYDLPFYDYDHRFRFSDPEIKKIKGSKIILLRKCEESVDKAIWMGGYLSYNYYHFVYEFAIKFLLLNTMDIPNDIPVYIDQICFNIPQYKELIDIMNKKNFPLIAAPRDYSYITKKLYYVNCPNILPPNYIDDNNIKFEDVQFNISELSELRNYLLPYSSNKSFPDKIFISRKNASIGLRKYNEDEVFEFLTGFGFETVFPEKLSFRDQISLFSQAKFIIGGSGAAFTNILFCSNKCKCIIFAKRSYPIAVFSTIASAVGVDLKYLTEEATKGKTEVKSFHDSFEIDIQYLRNQLLAWKFISEKDYIAD